MKMEENNIKNIVFRPQMYSLHEIQTMANDIVIKGQLSSVFGVDLFKSMMRTNCQRTIQSGSIYGINEASNLIVFWGVPHSGRTSAIFSMLSQEDCHIIWPQDVTLTNRIKKMLDIFSSKGPVFMPELSNDDTSEIYHVKYKTWQFGRTYNMSFFRPQDNYQDDTVLSILNSHQEQIHVFCIDCGKNGMTKTYLDDQVKYHQGVIKYLENKGFLKQSNGVYLLVTKSDLMNVPDIYEENAAQTFVTSGIPDFWHQIRDICYDKKIYNVQPVAFSIGNFILKDFTSIDSDYSKLFMKECILPKCQPNQNIVERILSIGKVKYAYYIAAIFFILICYGIKCLFNAIVPPPEQKVVMFNYGNYFKKQENGLIKMPISEAENIYKSLSQDLSVEKTLRLVNGDRVLPYDIYKQCDSVLVNDFSVVLMRELEDLFSSKRWTINETLLKKRDAQIVELLSHSSLQAASIRSYHNYINHYFYQIKPLLARSKKCMTVQEARTVVSQITQWKTYPYNKDTKLNKDISDAKINAYQSCANNYQRLANQKIREYNNEVSRGSTIISWFFSSDTHDELKRSFKNKTLPLVNNIDKIISDLRSASDNRLVSIRKSLERTQASIVKIYK